MGTTVLFRSTVLVFFILASAGIALVSARFTERLPWSIPLLIAVAVLWTAIALSTLEVVLAGASEAIRVLLAVAILVITVEGALTIASLGRPAGSISYFMWTPGLVARFHPAEGILPGVAYGESHFTVGPDGLRGRERHASDALRILAVGGSTTEELYIDDPDAWPALTERLLGARYGRPVWVGNAGKSGLDTTHHVVLLDTLGKELRPDVVVVLAGWNDMSHSLQGVLDTDDPLLQFETASGGPTLVDGNVRLTGLHTFWAARAVWRSMRRYLPTYEKAFVLQEDARSYLPSRAARMAAPKTEEAPANVDDLLAAYERRLHDLSRAARDIGARLVLLTQPSLDRDGPPTAEADAFATGGGWKPGSPVYYDASVISRLIAAFNQATLKVCASERLDCLDLAAAIPPDLDHFYDDVHLNTRGSREAGEAIAEFLAARVMWMEQGATFPGR